MLASDGVCGVADKDAATEIAQGAYKAVSSVALGPTRRRVVNVESLATVNLLAADLPKGGHWQVCYCAAISSCAAAASFLINAAEVTESARAHRQSLFS